MFMAKISVFVCFIILVFCFATGLVAKKEEDEIYELRKGDFSVKLTKWGAAIVSVVLPDKHGKLADVVLGYDSAKDYMNDTTYFGAIVGRVANRIGGAQFTLNGTHYKLVANEGKNMLHGGPKGFSRCAWKVSMYESGGHSPFITFTYHSFDGEEGFPGDLIASVTYMLVDNYQLVITMQARAVNKPTPVNLAQHAYWNLGGHNCGRILSNEIQIFGSHITPVDKELIPTGKIVPVKGTPYDFLEPCAIGTKINKLPSGYDINYALHDTNPRKLKLAAVVRHKKSGRVMELYTNAPGMQFYTSNFLKDVKGKGGFVYQEHAALCLETQGFPDSVNHPNFPSQIVTPAKPYQHFMIFKFSIQG